MLPTSAWFMLAVVAAKFASVTNAGKCVIDRMQNGLTYRCSVCGNMGILLSTSTHQTIEQWLNTLMVLHCGDEKRLVCCVVSVMCLFVHSKCAKEHLSFSHLVLITCFAELGVKNLLCAPFQHSNVWFTLLLRANSPPFHRYIIKT